MADINVIRKLPLFSSLGDEQLKQVAQLAFQKTFSKESVIFFEEDEGDSLFIINTGKVKVAKFSDDGKEFILAMLGPGDFFGDMSLLDGSPRSATIIAMENTKVSSIRRQ